MIYGNLRLENIVIKLDRKLTTIERIRFLGFGSIITIEESDQIKIPDQLEHLPPDMTSHLLTMQRFSNRPPNRQKAPQKKDVNVKFLQASASADVFALGVILLQIATGYPS